jgi:elongation factor G
MLENIVFPEPVISQAIEPKTKGDQDKLGTALTRLAQEDPTFRMRTDEETQQTIIAGMGELHLEIILDRLAASSRSKPTSASRRSPTKKRSPRPLKSKASSSGSPAAKASTATCGFASNRANRARASCSSGRSSAARFPKSTRRPSARGHREASQSGVLAGYPVLDFKATASTAATTTSTRPKWRSRSRHRWRSKKPIARPVRSLEPIMKVEVTTPKDYMGGITGDLNRRRGHDPSTEEAPGGAA